MANLPPTPQPSGSITGKSSANAPQLDNCFALPPAALSSRNRKASSSEPSEAASDSSYRPPSPASPVAALKTSHGRKRSSATSQQSVITKDDYSLPPPPTRRAKIIQMKPKDTQEPPKLDPQSQNTKATNATANGSKKKQANTTTAAGRKMARKTAHSLIERRRRSKMNEEFGVLKDMIPACRGEEMHKLAILQASIEYMRYLEQCVADLKIANQSRRGSPLSTISDLPPPPTARPALEDDIEDDNDDVEEDKDEEMEDVISPTAPVPAPSTSYHQLANASPAIYPSDRSVYTHSTTTSPAILPQTNNHGHYSANPSPALQPSDPHHYSLTSSVRSPSIHASPAFNAQTHSASHFSNPFYSGPPSTGPVPAPGSSHSVAPFALTSPMLKPQADREDQEATEALLMLNTDRRSWSSARGMSVRELLSG